MRTMTLWTLSGLVAITAAAAACGPAALAATPADTQAAHSHDAAMPSKLALDKGRKWATDAPLREGMARIRELADGGLALAHAGRLDAAQSKAVAGQVEAAVGQIVADCKLEPQADAMLHLVIADIGAGTDAMAGRTPGRKPEQGLVQLARAVNDYGRYFAHPGYRPLHTGH